MDNDLYREEILEHYRHPQNFGPIEKATHQGFAANPVCGDTIALELRVVDDKVEEAGFQGKGCALSTASASMFTEWLKGKTLKQLEKITEEDVAKLIAAPVTPTRMQCVLLPYQALRKSRNV